MKISFNMKISLNMSNKTHGLGVWLFIVSLTGAKFLVEELIRFVSALLISMT